MYMYGLPTNIAEVRESILRRPGMYFGTTDPKDDSLSPWLGAWALDVLRAGSRRLSIRVRADREVLVRHDAGAPDLYWQGYIEAVSTSYQRRAEGGDTVHAFRPDLAAFPMLALRERGRLVAVLRDAATAFPHAATEFEDEETDVLVRYRYPRGALDRLSEEAGLRLLGPRLSFRGCNGGVDFDVALAWANGPGLQVVALTNGERNANGGVHVYGVWEGIANALASRLAAAGAASANCRPEQLPRNAVLVVSVHVEWPEFGPATRDCLHHKPSREVIRDAVASAFFAELGDEVTRGNRPPWQTLAGVHWDSPWLERLGRELQRGGDDAEPPFLDPYAHREGHDQADVDAESSRDEEGP